MHKKFTLLLLPVIFFFLNNASAQTGWQWGVGSKYANAEAWPVAVDGNGNVFSSGWAMYDTTVFGADSVFLSTWFTGSSMNNGLLVTKNDPTGSFLWAKGTVNTSAWPVNIATDPDGDVYVFGIYIITSYLDTAFRMDSAHITIPAAAQEYFLLKLSSTGAVRWVKNVTNNNGGSSYYFGGMGIDGAGNVYVSGVFNCPIDTLGSFVFNNNSAANEYDAFVAKYDTSGNPVWAKSFGGANNDFVYTLSVTGTGDVYISGQYQSDTLPIGGVNLVNPLYTTSEMCYAAKFDSSGNVLWAKNIGRQIVVNGLKNDQAGNLYMTGSVDSSSVVLGPDTLTCNGLKDIFLAKYDLSGNPVWATSAGGGYTDQAFAVDVDTCGNIWITGAMGGGALAPGVPYTMNFKGNILHTLAGSIDPMFIAEYNNAGTYMTSSALRSGGDDQIGIAVDNRGNVYICGDYEDSTQVIGTYSLDASSFAEDFFLAKYNYSTGSCSAPTVNAVPAIPASAGITIYPNPAAYECTIESGAPFAAGSHADLYDLTGRFIRAYALYGNSTVISIAGLSPGMYECRIITGENNVVVKKLVVMK